MCALWDGLALVALIGVCTPALAEPPSSAKKDPNEVVCEKTEIIGTRLGARKVCATRAEWAEKRKLDREAVDQAQRTANGPCQTINTHTGAAAC